MASFPIRNERFLLERTGALGALECALERNWVHWMHWAHWYAAK